MEGGKKPGTRLTAEKAAEAISGSGKSNHTLCQQQEAMFFFPVSLGLIRIRTERTPWSIHRTLGQNCKKSTCWVLAHLLVDFFICIAHLL